VRFHYPAKDYVQDLFGSGAQ
jgi:hypothetical protein